MVKGLHASILPGCKCPWTPQETDCYGDGNVFRGVRSKDSFSPDYNTEAVLVEEMQRMAKRIEDLEAMPKKVDVKHKTKYYALLKEYDRVCYLLDKATDKITDQDAMLERQTARIVDLQTHINNLEGEE
jgi:hypothetical protein